MKIFTQLKYVPILVSVFLAGSFLLSACAPSVAATTEPMPAATVAPAATTAPTPDGRVHVSLNMDGIATGLQTETVAAVSSSSNEPYWVVLPDYTRVTLQGYPISSHLMQPQIFIYPLKELGVVNEGAGQIANTLKTLLDSPMEIQNMPFMPLFNAAQVLHVQIQYLDFKGGKGLRYVTQFDQAPLPVNNHELIYTYQGITSDGKYYIAAVLPVNHPSLPMDEKITGKEPSQFVSDFPAYLSDVVKTLNTQAATTFTPDLTQLDAMMSSLEIK